jgi:hypothetical protein
VRLACVKRAANVRSEPGSNSPVESGELLEVTGNPVELENLTLELEIRFCFVLANCEARHRALRDPLLIRAGYGSFRVCAYDSVFKDREG